jgi:hypothetical protein
MPLVRKGIGLVVLALVGCGSAGGSGTGGRDGGGLSDGGGSTPGGGSFGAGGAVGGASGAAGAIACTITATTTLSTAMPNVAIVTWSTDLPNLTGAKIAFAPQAGGTTLWAPVDLTQPAYRTLLLGMKPSTSYGFQIVASTAAGSCTSNVYALTTGALPIAPPTISTTIIDPAAHDRGFIVTSTGLSGNTTFIIDPDGAVVWAASGPNITSRAHLSWDGTRMYMMALNVANTDTGEVQVVSMDGTGMTSLPGLTASHHDLSPIPGGFATLLWTSSGENGPCSMVEYADATGALTTVVADMGSLYNSTRFHTNSIHYYPTDDTYTLSDREPNLFVKVTRGGQLIWQFGGSNPKDPSKFFSGVPTWMVNHGHQLLPDGTFVFFNNAAAEAWVYALDTENMTATELMGYTPADGAVSSVLGDAQRLPNGNYLVTFSTSGEIQEVSPSGKLIATFTSTASLPQVGYAEFRESLYGPPPY